MRVQKLKVTILKKHSTNLNSINPKPSQLFNYLYGDGATEDRDMITNTVQSLACKVLLFLK